MKSTINWTKLGVERLCIVDSSLLFSKFAYLNHWAQFHVSHFIHISKPASLTRV